MNRNTQIRPNGRMGSKNAGVITVPTGEQILYSYQTPVAIRQLDGTVLETEDAYHVYSSTTARHIREWVRTLATYAHNEEWGYDYITAFPETKALPFTEIKDLAHSLTHGITVDFQTNSSASNPIGNGARPGNWRTNRDR